MLQIFFAFLAGLLTIAAPCTLPLLPVLLGTSLDQKNKFRPVFIVLGFIIVFTLAAGILSIFARQIGLNTNIIRNAGIIILAFFGALLIWPKPFEFFAVKLTPLISKVSVKAGLGNKGNFSALLLGMTLGLVWTPCAGPVLASILTLIALQTDLLSATILLLFYSLGAGIPMLVIAFGGQYISKKVLVISKYSRLLQQIFGVIIILVAVMIYFNYDAKLYSLFGYSPIINPMTNQNPTNLINYGKAPEFKAGDNWINSQPLTMGELKGKIVLVDFWTYSCINCVRTLPHIKKLYADYKDKGLVVIGVHTPEFAFEQDTNNVKYAVSEFGVTYPVVQDNDYSIWNSYANQYWPAEYLIDQNGQIVYEKFGEGNYSETEDAILKLLGMAPVANQPAVNGNLNKIGSPEMYFGTDRLQYLTTAQKSSAKPQNYILDQNLDLNNFSLGGTWSFSPQNIQLSGESGQINLKFHSGKVFIVASSQKPAELTITVDGKAQPAVVVQESQLYTLFDSQDYSDHVIEINVNQPGFQAFTFTFG